MVRLRSILGGPRFLANTIQAGKFANSLCQGKRKVAMISSRWEGFLGRHGGAHPYLTKRPGGAKGADVQGRRKKRKKNNGLRESAHWKLAALSERSHD